MNRIDELNNLVQQIHTIEDSYGCLHRIVNNNKLISFIRQANLCDKYGLKMCDFYVSEYNNQIELRQPLTAFNFKVVQCPKTWRTNKTTHYNFAENEEYVILCNGNTGRLSLANVDLRDYAITDCVWNKFVDKIVSYARSNMTV